jgi:hypothetical protein
MKTLDKAGKSGLGQIITVKIIIALALGYVL